MQSKNIEIRRISGKEIAEAIDLSWEVFLQFEAPEYSEEGVRTFRESLDDKKRAASLDWFGACRDDFGSCALPSRRIFRQSGLPRQGIRENVV